MKKVDFEPANHPRIDQKAWKKWAKRANKAQQVILAWLEAKRQTLPPGNPPPQPEFQDAVWTQLKDLILESVFRGHCAFCEVKANVGGFGDAEHYRPKKAVQAPDNEQKLKPIQINGDEHPGYHWLAYDWQNVTPACSQCNNRKGNQFPIAGTHCIGPEPGKQTTLELNACEQPLLLHPYFDEPRKHITVGVRGIIAARNSSLRGKTTIDVCGLDREPLREEREKAQIGARNEVYALVHHGKKILEAVPIVMQRCDAGEEAYSLAILDELCRMVQEVRQEREREMAEADGILAARKV